MTVRVYRWDDAGAPALSGTAGALVGVLDACLVSGYGAQTAAGWAIAFTGTNKRVYRAAVGTRAYLRFDDSGTTNAVVWAAEDMTDVDTPVGGTVPTSAQAPSGLYAFKSSTANTTARPWLMVADERRFHLWIGHSATTAAGLATTAYMMMYFFGDIESFLPGDAFNFLICANTSTSAASNQYATGGNATGLAGGHYLLRATDQLATSVALSKQVDVRAAIGGIIGAYDRPYPDAVTGGMQLSKVFLAETTTRHVRGAIPGLWAPVHSLPASPGDTLAGRGALAGKTLLLLDAASAGTRGRVALEISDTWS